MRRRDFLKQAAAIPATALAARPGAADPTPRRARPLAPRKEKVAGWMVGVQIHPYSLFDEGFDRCLDILQEKAAVDTLLIYSHLYAADPNMPAEVLAPDHGIPVRPPATRNLPRVWVRHSRDAFDGVLLRHPTAPREAEYADRDLFAELAEPLKKRKMRLFARALEPRGPSYLAVIPNWGRVLTVDHRGRPGLEACWNNPDYQDWWLRTVEDVCKNYPLDGYMFGAERVGPLSRLLGFGQAPSCFCRHCLARARDEGIDARRLRQGFGELYDLVSALRQGEDLGADGAFSSVLRVLMKYSEILAWEYDWARSMEEVVAGVTGTVKGVRPKAVVGRHVDHQQTSWDFLYRASVSIAELAEPVDFLKPATYHDIAAPRVRHWLVEQLGKSLFRDLPAELRLGMYYAGAGLDPAREPKLEEMMNKGFSADYVFRETKRFVEGAAGRVAVYPGIAMDIPWHSPEGPKRFPSRPENVYEATRKAFEAGADGIIVSREYQEMRLPNLEAVGKAVREVAGSKKPQNQ